MPADIARTDTEMRFVATAIIIIAAIAGGLTTLIVGAVGADARAYEAAFDAAIPRALADTHALPATVEAYDRETLFGDGLPTEVSLVVDDGQALGPTRYNLQIDPDGACAPDAPLYPGAHTTIYVHPAAPQWTVALVKSVGCLGLNTSLPAGYLNDAPDMVGVPLFGPLPVSAIKLGGTIAGVIVLVLAIGATLAAARLGRTEQHAHQLARWQALFGLDESPEAFYHYVWRQFPDGLDNIDRTVRDYTRAINRALPAELRLDGSYVCGPRGHKPDWPAVRLAVSQVPVPGLADATNPESTS